jgi:hypothetical protein
MALTSATSGAAEETDGMLAIVSQLVDGSNQMRTLPADAALPFRATTPVENPKIAGCP